MLLLQLLLQLQRSLLVVENCCIETLFHVVFVLLASVVHDDSVLLVAVHLLLVGRLLRCSLEVLLLLGVLGHGVHVVLGLHPCSVALVSGVSTSKARTVLLVLVRVALPWGDHSLAFAVDTLSTHGVLAWGNRSLIWGLLTVSHSAGGLVVLVRVPVDPVSNGLPRGAEHGERVHEDVVPEDLLPVPPRAQVKLTLVRLSLLVQVLDCGFVVSGKLEMELEEESHEDCHEPVQAVADLNQRALYEFLLISFSQVEIKNVHLPPDAHQEVVPQRQQDKV